MSNIFGIMNELELTRDDVLQAEVFAQQYLESKFPEVDFRQGTGVRDMVIRPSATLIALVNKAIAVYFEQMSIKDITNDTPEETADKILSNFFITRKAGENSVVRARLYFAFPGNRPQSLQIPSTAYFSTDNERKFYPQASMTVDPPTNTPVPGVTYMQYDSAEDLWYADLSLISEAPSEDYSLEEGDLIYFTIFSPYFIKGTVLYLEKAAVAREKNTEMVVRAPTAISTRNLINDPSVEARLHDTFDYVRDILVVGHGDKEMYRDQVTINDPDAPGGHITYKSGGHVDVYCSTPITKTVKQYITDEHGDVYIQGPIYHVSRSPVTGDPDGVDDLVPVGAAMSVTISEGTRYNSGVPVNPLKDYGLSARQQLKISFGDMHKDSTASLIVKSFVGISDIEEYLKAKLNRVVCANYMARGFEPVQLDVTISTHSPVVYDAVTTEKAVREYVEGIKRGGIFYVSELTAILDDAGIKGIVTPIEIPYAAVNKNLEVASGTINDTFNLSTTQKFLLNRFVVNGG